MTHRPLPPAIVEALEKTTQDFEPYRWAPLKGKPDTYARQLWGGECYYHQFSKVAANTADATGLYIMSFDAVSPAEMQVRMLHAWLGMRYDAPLIGAKILEDVGIPKVPKHLGCFVYEALRTKEDLLAWGNRTVHFQTPQPGEDFHDAADRMRKHITGRSCGPESMSTLWVMMSTLKDSKGRYKCCICVNGPHSIFDAAGGNRAFRCWFKYLADPDFDPFVLDWGKGDVDNLPPTGIEAVGMNPEILDPEVMKRAILPYAIDYGQPLALRPQRPHRGPIASGTRHTIRFIEPKIVKGLRTAIKSRSSNFGISHAIDAARHTAVWYLCARDAARTGVPIAEKYIVNAFLPVDTFRYLQGKWKDSVYLCSATLGFTTAIPVAFWNDFDVNGDPEVVQQSSFDVLLPVLSSQWARGRHIDIKSEMMVMNPLLDLQGVRIDNPVHLRPQKPIDAFTSLGLVEKLIPESFVTDEGPFRGVASSTSRKAMFTVDFACPYPRLAYTATCMHTWAFNDTVSISLAFTEEYDEEFIDEFLDIIISILTRAAESNL